MAAGDWNWRLPPDYQDYPWDCSACSLAWSLRASGHNYSEQDVISGLGPSRISPSLGLLDASGAGLVEYLGEIGISGFNNPSASFDDVIAAAGYQPLCIGGRAWGHWVAVRMSSTYDGRPNTPALALMNPAPGWLSVEQILYPDDFDALGPFSAVWFTL